MNHRLEDRVVVVTGAARGLGRHFAHQLAADGARVAVIDTDLHSYARFTAEADAMTADTTDAELRERGHDSRGYEADLTDPAATRQAFAAILADFCRIDGLVCNAGGGSGAVSGNRAGELPLAELESALRRNLFTTVNCCTAAAGPMRERRSGSIVNLASVNGIRPTANGCYAHYGVAKAAVVMYTKYLARDLAKDGIRANALAPATVPTGRLTEAWSRTGGLAGAAADVPMNRLPALDEITQAVRFLISDESSYITGQILAVDGGATL
jgi:3-oxoacyl-[acyl-carrier protein] reductase